MCHSHHNSRLQSLKYNAKFRAWAPGPIWGPEGIHRENARKFVEWFIPGIFLRMLPYMSVERFWYSAKCSRIQILPTPHIQCWRRAAHARFAPQMASIVSANTIRILGTPQGDGDGRPPPCDLSIAWFWHILRVALEVHIFVTERKEGAILRTCWCNGIYIWTCWWNGPWLCNSI